MTSSTIHPYRHKQLFLDDGAIETKRGLRRTLNKPERAGPVMRPDRSRGQVTLQSATAPQWNSEKRIWEWWYRAGHSGAPAGTATAESFSSFQLMYQLRLYHYATSSDGVNWEKPNLGLYDWLGSKDNNVAVDPHGMTMYNVLRDERDEDPSRRYKALFADGGSDRYPAVSPDGFDWTMIDVPPIPSGDTSYLTYDPYTGRFLATVKVRTDWGRAVWLSTSNDFVDWTEAELIFEADEIDKNNRRRRVRRIVEDPAYLTPPFVDDGDYIAEIYKMAIMPYEGLYIGFPVLLNPSGSWLGKNQTGVNQTELAVSRDLRTWSRVANRDLFLDVLPWDGETYDTAQVIPCGTPIVREDLGQIWVYYDTCRFRARKDDVAEEHRKYFDEDLNAVAVAKVRLDGFVSLDADKRGTLLTRPFDLEGGRLVVNADASAGRIAAEVVDALTGDPVAGLSEGDCVPVGGDSLGAVISWKGGAELGHHGPVRVRFSLEGARLYAFWLER